MDQLTKEELQSQFRLRCHDVAREWLLERLDEYIDRAFSSGSVDYELLKGNYSDVYGLMAAIFHKVEQDCLNGSLDYKTQRKCKREANWYNHFIIK